MTNDIANSIQELVEYSDIDFDRTNIQQEADRLGVSWQTLAQEIADIIAYRWNRMTRDEDDFNQSQDRLMALHRWIKRSKV